MSLGSNNIAWFPCGSQKEHDGCHTWGFPLQALLAVSCLSWSWHRLLPEPQLSPASVSTRYCWSLQTLWVFHIEKWSFQLSRKSLVALYSHIGCMLDTNDELLGPWNYTGGSESVAPSVYGLQDVRGRRFCCYCMALLTCKLHCP